MAPLLCPHCKHLPYDGEPKVWVGAIAHRRSCPTFGDVSRVHVGGIVVSPSEVRARAAGIDGQWSTLAVDATHCPLFAPHTPNGDAFDTDLAAWKIFFQANSDTFWSAGSVNDQLDGWQTALLNWQNKIKGAGCTITGIPVQPPDKPKLPEIPTSVMVALGAVLATVLVVTLKK